MSPIELFEVHRSKAERVAERLCWHYQISGALRLVQDAKQEACLALFKESSRFKPRRQAFARRKDRMAITAVYWSILRKQKREALPEQDPYSTFWMFAVARVQGSVIDFFRKQRIIQRLPQAEADQPVFCERCTSPMLVFSQECEHGGFCRQPRTMLYHERFLSASGSPDDDSTPCRSTYFDLFASRERADAADDLNHTRYQILSRAKAAGLDYQEMKVVTLMCSEDMSKEDVAVELKTTIAWVGRTLRSAANKMTANKTTAA